MPVMDIKAESGSATESRTPVSALRGRRPGPLDDGASFDVSASLPLDANPGSRLRGTSAPSQTKIAVGQRGLKPAFEAAMFASPRPNRRRVKHYPSEQDWAAICARQAVRR